MNKLILSNTNVYPWKQLDEISFRGYFIIDNVLYKGEEAITFLLERLNHTKFDDVLTTLNGVFSIIMCKNDEVYFATDRLRALPLFYTFLDGDLIISDNANSIYNVLPTVAFDPISIEDYKKNGLFVTGQDTLFKEIKQVQAGEWVRYSKKSGILSYFPYYEYIHGDFIIDKNILKEDFWKAYKQVGKNLIKALNGRTAVIPLSGGADSRMIATLLKNEGYDNVICFSYGKINNAESQMSKTVADSLNFKWNMVPYTRKLWRKLKTEKTFYDYFEFSGNFTSLPHEQDFLAVKILKEANLIPKDSVFIPGHTGDLIAGGHITAEFLQESLSPVEFMKAVYHKFYKTEQLSESIKEKIQSNFTHSLKTSIEDLASYIEWFNIRERQAKYIVNSVRIYEFFGYEWLIPLWDNILFDYWKHVPISWRYGRKLYFECVNDGKLRSTNDITLYKFIGDMIRKIPYLRTFIRKLSKIPKYYFSPLQIGGLYSFSDYLKGCLLGDEYFSTNDLGNQLYFDLLKEKN